MPKCGWEDCEADATMKAVGRDESWHGRKGHPGLADYCENHGPLVADEGAPEYVETCPHCGCMFGVN